MPCLARLRGPAASVAASDARWRSVDAGTLRNLVLQRAIQTKLYHLNLVRNQAMFEFLQNFLDHQHLKIIRITDYDFKCQFHGTDGVCVRARARTHARTFPCACILVGACVVRVFIRAMRVLL